MSSIKNQAQTDADTLTVERTKTKKPRRFHVIMHNDDYTTQEFVIHVLIHYFRKEPGEATQLMLAVHLQGRAKVGIYTKDVAESKVAVVTSYARENGMPLMLSAEPE